MGRLVPTSHIKHSGLDGEDAVLNHIGRRHADRLVIGIETGEGILGRCGYRGGRIRWDTEVPYIVSLPRIGSRRKILSYCKGNCGPVGNTRSDDTSRGSKVV